MCYLHIKKTGFYSKVVRENLELKTTIAKMAAELKENKSKVNSAIKYFENQI